MAHGKTVANWLPVFLFYIVVDRVHKASSVGKLITRLPAHVKGSSKLARIAYKMVREMFEIEII